MSQVYKDLRIHLSLKLGYFE